ncbi:MAG: CapA family protein [Clostridia bacterium]|nr:CapA family protein [Clostridia bacterium]
MRILIGADFVPTESNEELFKNADIDALFGQELKEILLGADYRIFNLETAITDGGKPITKAGPNLVAKPETLNAYKAIGVDLVTISNNHVFDLGEEGFQDTVRHLKEYGIATVGGGFTKEEAKKPHIFTLGGKKIGVYACCEHEFSWIEDYGIGCNGFDPLECPDAVAALKKEVDYCIVLYHGGKEHYPYPSPWVRKRCRKFAEKGADLVICQHTHCIGAREEYMGAELVYGQGNFLFDHSDKECWKTNVLCAVDIDESGVKVSYIPVEKQGERARLSENPAILDGFNRRSEEIQTEGFVEKKYDEFAVEMQEWYLNVFKQWLDPSILKCDRRVALLNFIECEAHRELMIAALKQLDVYENRKK